MNDILIIIISAVVGGNGRSSANAGPSSASCS